jgi:hypothetical protein
MYGELQMNKSYQIFVLMLLFITVSIQGCSEGGSSGSNSGVEPIVDKAPIDPVEVIPNENEFVIASFNIADDMKAGEAQSIQLNLESLALSESKIVYFEWQNLGGGTVLDGSISPVKGIIRPQKSSAQFSYEYTPKTEGTQLFNLILTSENKKEIIKNVELSTVR